jgi:uncharacterized protein HemY
MAEEAEVKEYEEVRAELLKRLPRSIELHSVLGRLSTADDYFKDALKYAKRYPALALRFAVSAFENLAFAYDLAYDVVDIETLQLFWRLRTSMLDVISMALFRSSSNC